MKTGLLEPLTSVVLQNDELFYSLKTKEHRHGGEHINPYVIEPLTDVNGNAADFIIAVDPTKNIYFRNTAYTNTINEAIYCGANGQFSSTKFLAKTGDTGGFSFINDGNADTGMFSDSDGVLIFKTNAMYLFGTAANLASTTSNAAAHLRFMGNIYANGSIFTREDLTATANIYCESGMLFANNLLAHNYLAVGMYNTMAAVANIAGTIQLLSNNTLGGLHDRHTAILFGAGLTSEGGWSGGAELYMRGASGWGTYDANNYLTVKKSGVFQYDNKQLATREFVAGVNQAGKILIVDANGTTITWSSAAAIIGGGAIAQSGPISVTNSNTGSVIGLNYKSTHFAVDTNNLVLANVNSSSSGKYLKVVQSGASYDVAWTNVMDDISGQNVNYGLTGNGTVGSPLAIIGVQGGANANKYLRVINGGGEIEWKTASNIIVDGLTPTPPITLTNGVILIPAATTNVDGYLTYTDWAHFTSAYIDTQAATNLNTVSAIVARDASGNFSAGTITANLTGNCSGTSSSFTGNLTGEVTSIGMATTVADGVIDNANIKSAAEIADTKLATISTAGKVLNSATTATSANTISAIVARDASGNFSAGKITTNLLWTTGANGGGFALIDNECKNAFNAPIAAKTIDMKTTFTIDPADVASSFDLDFSTGRYGISNTPIFKIRNILGAANINPNLTHAETYTTFAYLRNTDGNWDQIATQPWVTANTVTSIAVSGPLTTNIILDNPDPTPDELNRPITTTGTIGLKYNTNHLQVGTGGLEINQNFFTVLYPLSGA